MKVALAFWGLTRSLKYTIKSIKERVFNILNSNKIEYDIYIHTYFVNDKFNNTRTKENNILLDNLEYKLLNPKYVKIDDLNNTKEIINLLQYRTHPDPWGTKYNSVDNFICAMYSKMEVTKLIENNKIKYDYIIFLRPDVKYLNNFDIKFLKLTNEKNVCIPNFHLFSNFNDRFFIGVPKNAFIYGKLFEKLLEYSKKKSLHSETFNYYYIKEVNKLNINYIKFFFNRIRANGFESIDCKI
jgi:hypothetical protein